MEGSCPTCADNETIYQDAPSQCRDCGKRTKKVETVTLKCLLIPEALKQLNPNDKYSFCSNPGCPTVYIGYRQTFLTDELIVPVFQKNQGEEVPVCYCFGYTRGDVQTEQIPQTEDSIFDTVSKLVKSGQCACEFRNPQGSCCLGNIRSMRKN